jgi:hypothetical protein
MKFQLGNCETCEVLKEQLFAERTEKALLQRKLFELMENQNGKHIQEPKEQETQVVPQELVAHRSPKRFTSALRAELEAQDRILANQIEADKRREQSIKELEEKLRLGSMEPENATK